MMGGITGQGFSRGIPLTNSAFGASGPPKHDIVSHNNNGPILNY